MCFGEEEETEEEEELEEEGDSDEEKNMDEYLRDLVQIRLKELEEKEGVNLKEHQQVGCFSRQRIAFLSLGVRGRKYVCCRGVMVHTFMYVYTCVCVFVFVCLFVCVFCGGR